MTDETEVNGDSKSTNDRGPSLVGSLGLSCRRYKRFCSALAALVGPVQNIFSSPCAISMTLSHRPASWAGSRVGSPVSQCVSLSMPQNANSGRNFEQSLTFIQGTFINVGTYSAFSTGTAYFFTFSEVKGPADPRHQNLSYFSVRKKNFFFQVTAIFKPTIPFESAFGSLYRNRGYSTVSLGTEDGVIHFILMKNVSAALSLLNQVCNPIQQRN